MFKLFFATPDKKIVSNVDLEEITLPADAGELNILPGHAPLMTTLDGGILKYKLVNGESAEMAISWGYCQVSSDGVTVLAETAVLADEIDTKTVRSRLNENIEKLGTALLEDDEFEKTRHEIARLQAELDLVGEKSH